MAEKIKRKGAALVISRRFWVALAGLLAVVSDGFGTGLSKETIDNITMVVGAWIVGDSLRETA